MVNITTKFIHQKEYKVKLFMMKENSKFQRSSKDVLKSSSRSGAKWLKYNYKVISSDSKDDIMKSLSLCLIRGARIGKQIFAGSNTISKLLETSRAGVIVICRDSNHVLHDHLVDAARLKQVPIIIFPKSSEELAKMFKFKRISCFALLKENNDIDNQSPQKVEDDVDCDTVEDNVNSSMPINAAIDNLREKLLEFAC